MIGDESPPHILCDTCLQYKCITVGVRHDRALGELCVPDPGSARGPGLGVQLRHQAAAPRRPAPAPRLARVLPARPHAPRLHRHPHPQPRHLRRGQAVRQHLCL